MQLNAISNALYGIQRATTGLNQASHNIATASVEGSDVNIEQEAVSLLANERLYKANAKVIQSSNDTLGSILDIKA